MPAKKRAEQKSQSPGRARPGGRGKSLWSADVTRHSRALDLESAVFKYNNPRRIAASLKRSAERSRKRKTTPYQSAMSMLNFYINRAGQNLPQSRKSILMRSKGELRKAFGKDSA